MDLYTIRSKLNMGVAISSIKLRVTYYSRVSTDHLEQKSSLRNQIAYFDEMISSNKNWIYVDGYVDEGISGVIDYKRNNFMKMIEDARDGKFDLIITKEISRFSRNTLDSIKYTRELLSYGVFVLFVNDSINTALPDSELRLAIMASMAQDEIRRLSERVKFGMNRAIKNGNILGNNLLYGYKKNKNTGNLFIVKEEAVNVRRLFHMYAIDCLSINRIVNIFNGEGLFTNRGSKWSVSTIARMLRNPKYKGYYCGKKSEVVDYVVKKVRYFEKDEWVMYKDVKKIPPIVDEKLWNRANLRLESRGIKFGDDYSNDKIIYKDRYLFSAKIYCAFHQVSFHRRKSLRASDDISWFCCKYLQNGKEVCDSPNIRQSELCSIFLELFGLLGIDISSISNILINLYQNNINDLHFDKEVNNILELKEKLLSKINLDVIRDKLIQVLLDKIIAFKINNDKNYIGLDIFLNYIFDKNNYSSVKKCLTKSFEFKRGYNTISTKRYIIKYLVTVYVYM